MKPSPLRRTQVGDSNYANGLSPVMSFRQPKSNFPFRISAWGDSGLTKQSLGTFRDIKKRMDAAAASRRAKSDSNATGVWPDLMINVGDLSYADKWTAAGKEGKGSSFQPRWDQFSRMIQSLFSTAIPMISNNGNHGAHLAGSVRFHFKNMRNTCSMKCDAPFGTPLCVFELLQTHISDQIST